MGERLPRNSLPRGLSVSTPSSLLCAPAPQDGEHPMHTSLTSRARRWGAATLALLLLTTLSACGAEDDGGDASNNGEATNNGQPANNGANNGDAQTIEIIGEYNDSFGGMLIVTSDQWIGVYDDGMGNAIESASALISFDNDQNYAVVQSPPDDAFTPNLFARQVWTTPADDGSFFYCTAAFGLESAQAARDAEGMADDTDPATGGCGGAFPWTMVTPQ